MAWLEESRPISLATEQIVLSLSLRYCGTMDWLCWMSGATFGCLFLIDLKSGVPEKWHGLQTAGYARALHEVDPQPIRRGSLYLFKNGKKAKLQAHHHVTDDTYFQYAVALYGFNHA